MEKNLNFTLNTNLNAISDRIIYFNLWMDMYIIYYPTYVLNSKNQGFIIIFKLIKFDDAMELDNWRKLSPN